MSLMYVHMYMFMCGLSSFHIITLISLLYIGCDDTLFLLIMFRTKTGLTNTIQHFKEKHRSLKLSYLHIFMQYLCEE